MIKYIGVNEYGNVFKIEKYPVKEILEQTGYKSYSKMYVDDKNGNPKHIGYVFTLRGFNPIWVTLYKVSEFEGVKNERN